MLSVVGSFVAGTIIPCLPALVALLAWGEGGGRLLRQFGARMLWEISGLVVVGVGVLLYATLQIVGEDAGNIFVIAVGSVCSVMAVTAATYWFPDKSQARRGAMTAAASLFGLQGGLAIGVLLYMLLWQQP